MRLVLSLWRMLKFGFVTIYAGFLSSILPTVIYGVAVNWAHACERCTHSTPRPFNAINRTMHFTIGRQLYVVHFISYLKCQPEKCPPKTTLFTNEWDFCCCKQILGDFLFDSAAVAVFQKYNNKKTTTNFVSIFDNLAIFTFFTFIIKCPKSIEIPYRIFQFILPG